MPEKTNTFIFYNGTVKEKSDEPKIAWDPSLFNNKEDCFAYLKSHYGDDFCSPVYVIETVKVGNGWEVIHQEISEA
jgi:hypothetical protein